MTLCGRFSSGGMAEWNYRMKWRLFLPCKVPRVKLSLWDHSEFHSGTSIGEAVYNLKPFFERCMREKQSKNHLDQRWIPFKVRG